MRLMQHRAMHFPVYLIAIFFATHVIASNYPDWSQAGGQNQPSLQFEQLNLSYVHRHNGQSVHPKLNRDESGGKIHPNIPIDQHNHSHTRKHLNKGVISNTHEDTEKRHHSFTTDEYESNKEINGVENESKIYSKHSEHHYHNQEIVTGTEQNNGNYSHPNFLRNHSNFAHRHPSKGGKGVVNRRGSENEQNSSNTHRHFGVHRHGTRGVSGENNAVVNEIAKGVESGVNNGETEKLTVVDIDASTGIQYNPYGKHQPGRHVCTRNSNKPVKTKQPYCKPTFKNYVIRCQGNQICKGVRLVYETHYKEVSTKNSNELVYACCPGWTQVSNRSNGCAKAACSKPCLNGGKCVKPELCACVKGFAGRQCEIPVNPPECKKPCLNGGKCVKKNACSCLKGFDGPQCENDLTIPHCTRGCENNGTCVQNEICECRIGFTGRRCEKDVDECKEHKPCDQICYNTPGSYNCQCKEDFVLQKDGQTCRKEDDNGDGGIEAKDLEFEMLDKRLLKLETKNKQLDMDSDSDFEFENPPPEIVENTVMVTRKQFNVVTLDLLPNYLLTKMMDESHKNDVSKDDLKNVYKDIDLISEDMSNLKSKIDDVENYKNDMYTFKTKLGQIEKKAEKVDDLMLKYDRMKKCAFYNKICM